MTRAPTSTEIEAFRAKLEVMVNGSRIKSGLTDPTHIETTIGNRYAKLIKSYGGQNRSTYGFIDLRNGDLLKAASWNAPAKHARGNIFAPDPLAGCGPYGLAYLRY
jgi:hypothetical protein